MSFYGLIAHFFFSAESYSIVWMDLNLSIQSPTEGHLGCFQDLAVMYKVAINICVQVFV